jgi:exopolysaccharide biosynthesis polyprenyl glycosylphosphotransferase
MTAVMFDALAIAGGFVLALWLRFTTDWIPQVNAVPPLAHMARLSLIATVLFLVVFRSLGLYRGNIGRFEDKIPRIIRAILWGFLVYIAAEAILRFEPRFSRPALAMAFVTISVLVLLERYVLYRIEWNLARHLDKVNRVLVVGTDAMAARLGEAILNEPFLRSQVVGFLATSDEAPRDVPGDQVLGGLGDLPAALEKTDATEVVLTDIGIGHDTMVDLIVTCEKQMVSFHLVPDLFRILTSGVDIHYISGVPVMGIGKWPLDYVSRRFLKRSVDIAGSLAGLVLAAPVVAVAAALIKTTSPGPVFYRQERCGENSRTFTMYKLRTMRADAEKEGQDPGWTQANDPRRTRVGSVLRQLNIDELPQFWNVLRGDMSLVGPRPERPFFVAQFKDEIDRYMRRHVCKPGITGWAQVNGLRGDTSIQERIRLDLYYLENWSLALDFKILLKTLFTRENAY